MTRLLEAVGMEAQADKRPDQMSGGQKQRVAAARALVSNAKLVLADEPTASLDHATAYRIIELMKQMRDEFDTTFVFSTHDPKVEVQRQRVDRGDLGDQPRRLGQRQDLRHPQRHRGDLGSGRSRRLRPNRRRTRVAAPEGGRGQ